MYTYILAAWYSMAPRETWEYDFFAKNFRISTVTRRTCLCSKACPTVRATDGGYATRFSGIFVALGFFHFDGASTLTPISG